MAAGRILRRSDSQGREPRRSAGAGADEIRVRHQPEDREGARPRTAGEIAYDRRRGDRMMRRREFITLLGGAVAAWPLAANGQQAENPVRIGFLPLGSLSDTYDQSLVEAFRDGLRKIGVVENRHVVLDFAWVRNESELPRAVTELMQRGAKLLITCGTSASVAAKRQVSTIPILFITVGKPVGVGLVASLSQPGGNATGFSDMHADLGGKYVEFAIELGKPQAPVDYLWYSAWADGQHRLEVTERAAQLLGVKLRTRAITDITEANDAFAAMKVSGAVTVIIQSSPFSYRRRG